MSDSTEGELKGEEEPEKKVDAVGSGGGRGSKKATKPRNEKLIQGRGSRNSRTVFISNLSPRVKIAQLRKILAEVGVVVESIWLEKRMKHAFAFVVFSTPNHVGNTLTLNRTKFKGRKICVKRYEKPRHKAFKPWYKPRNKPRKKLELSTNKVL